MPIICLSVMKPAKCWTGDCNFLPRPNSFTGEDVLELQGHGGPVILDLLLKRILLIDNIRIANPVSFQSVHSLMTNWIWHRRKPLLT